MNDDLEAIRYAWDKDTGGRDEAQTRRLSDEYVAANPDVYAGFENLGQTVLVRQIDEARDNGDDEEVWTIQAWLFHHFEPQKIGATVQSVVRLPNGE